MADKGGVAARLRARRSKELQGRIDRVGSRRPTTNRLILGVSLSVMLAAMMVDWTPRAGTAGLEEGDIAPTDIRAYRTFEVEDRKLTLERRMAARDGVAPNYEYDVQLGPEVERRIDKAFQEMRAFLAAQSPPVPPPQASAGEEGEPGTTAEDDAATETDEPEDASGPTAPALRGPGPTPPGPAGQAAGSPRAGVG